jgi:ubiquinone/menaquinone biosynthesis C-methylase UbiE
MNRIIGTAGDDDVADLYDRWAETYDTDANRTRDLAGVVLRREVTETAGRDIVELGCGTGANTAWLAERARSVVAVDFSAAMLGKARARLAAPHVGFLQADIRAPLPLRPASADLVVIVLVLEHVQDLATVMDECARVLRPDGALFVCELHPYRQWRGVQAEFVDRAAGDTVRVPAYVHEVSEFANHGVGSGFVLARTGEWRDEADHRNGAGEGVPARIVVGARVRHVIGMRG